MSARGLTLRLAITCLAVLLLVTNALAAPKHCAPIGGTFSTNLGGFGPNTTLGVITGDLKGAVGVQVVGMNTASDGVTTVTVQHHLVTETGDTVFIDQAEAIGVFVAPGLFALTNYHIHISGGTGRYKGATGQMSAIGEADFNSGILIGRYTGELCTVATGTP
jgi:hypothetical protein